VRLTGRCVKVIDGDTIKVRLADGRKIKVRFLGIDAPESSSYRYGYTEKYGRTAKSFITCLLLNQQVNLLVYKTRSGRIYRGRYKRVLAYVYLNGIDISKLLLLRGFAKVYRKKRCLRFDEFITYERRAKYLGLGIWG
jgi:micrococcal nuclease